MTFIPSKYQLDIFKAYRETNSNLVINAAPGSGKTTQVLELLKVTPIHKKTIFLAFNKSISEELSKKVPQNVKVSTIHSLGVGLLYKNLTCKLKITEFKNFGLAKKHLDIKHVKPDKLSVYIFNLSKMIDIYRLYLCNNRESFEQVLDQLGFYILNGELDYTMQLIEEVDKYNSNKNHSEMMIDFTDMLYLPLYYEVDFPKYDVVFCDELQDLSLLQKRLVDKLIKPKTGRFVAVGDKKQLIYQFIGANRQSFQEFIDHPNTIQLPLSVSYRCPKKVIEVANKIFDGVEAYENNTDGEVIYDGNFDDIQNGDFVLCRNNMPLVELWLRFVSEGKKAIIYGKEYEKGLINIIYKIDSSDTELALKQMDDMLLKLKEELKEKNVLRPEGNPKFQSLLEKITILRILTRRYGSFEEVERRITDMFSDDTTKGIILSTVHKMKGRETDNVYAYMYHLIPSKFAETMDEIYAERCLAYVLITRAKRKLIFVD